jgi:nucleoside-diphosphate-sugar epimerase
MKALVTGAAGFIGSHLAEALIERGYEVTCITRRTSRLRWIEHLDVEYILCDLADIESCSAKLRDFDYIFHLAGVTKALSERDYFLANAVNTRRLVQAAARENPTLKRFVYMSSLAAIGPSNGRGPVSEESVPAPVSIYGRSKLEGERAVGEFRDRIPVTIIRPPAVYGPRDADFFVMFKMIKKGFFPYWGKCYYSLLYVEDLIRGIILSAEKEEAEGGTFFLADQTVYTNEEIAEEICAALGSRTLKIHLPRPLLPLLAFFGQKMDKKGIINADRIHDFRYSHWTCDGGKARDALGYKSKITLREGIKWTADWYKIHRWL